MYVLISVLPTVSSSFNQNAVERIIISEMFRVDLEID